MPCVAILRMVETPQKGFKQREDKIRCTFEEVLLLELELYRRQAVGELHLATWSRVYH